MVDLLILLLFVGSGAAAGWLGIHLLPEQLVKPDTDAAVSYTHLTLPTTD